MNSPRHPIFLGSKGAFTLTPMHTATLDKTSSMSKSVIGFHIKLATVSEIMNLGIFEILKSLYSLLAT